MTVPAFTQTKTYSTNTAATSHAITLTSAVTPSGGSVSPAALVAVISYDGASGNQISSITDTSGNTWQRGTSQSNASSVNCEAWYAYNVVGGVTPTITINLSSSLKISAVIAEIDQVRCVSPLDQATGRIDTTNSTARTSVSAKRNGMIEIVVGFMGWNHATLNVSAAGTGFTQLTSIKDGSSNIGAALIRRTVDLNNLTAANTLARFTMSATSTTPCAVLSLTFYRDGVATCDADDGYIDNFEGFVTVENAALDAGVFKSSTSAPYGGTGGSEKTNAYAFIPSYAPYLLSGVTIGPNTDVSYYATYAFEDGTSYMMPYISVFNDDSLGNSLDSSDETWAGGYTVVPGIGAFVTGLYTFSVPTSSAYSASHQTEIAMQMDGDTQGGFSSSQIGLLTFEGNATWYLRLDLQYPVVPPTSWLPAPNQPVSSKHEVVSY